MTYNQKMDRLSFTVLYVYFCITIDLPGCARITLQLCSVLNRDIL